MAHITVQIQSNEGYEFQSTILKPASVFSKIEVRAVNHVVVDGIELDLRGAESAAETTHSVVGQSKYATLSRDAAGQHSLLVVMRAASEADQINTTTDVQESSLPYYALWPSGEAQTPQTITGQSSGNQPVVSDAVYARRFKDAQHLAAVKFEEQFNPNWAAMVTRDKIHDPLSAVSAIQVNFEKKQLAVDEWGRAWVGFMTKLVWFMEHNVIDCFKGLVGTFDRAKLRELYDSLQTESNIGARAQFATNNADDWAGKHELRELYTTDRATGSVKDMIYKAASMEEWTNIKTAWFYAARWRDYPTQGTLVLVDVGTVTPITAATVGTAIEAAGTDPSHTDVAKAIKNKTFMWQITSDDGATWSDIASAMTSTYTPVAADVGKKVRCMMCYTNANGFMIASVSDWSDDVVAASA